MGNRDATVMPIQSVHKISKNTASLGGSQNKVVDTNIILSSILVSNPALDHLA